MMLPQKRMAILAINPEVNGISALPALATLQENVVEKAGLGRPCHANALTRIAMYATSDDAERLSWWSHPDRAAMRDDPRWALVFSHISLAGRGSE